MDGDDRRELRARVLVDAAASTDEAAAKKHGVGVRSIERWRAQLADDPELAEEVQGSKTAAAEAWLKDVPQAMAKAVSFLARATEQADASDPDAIHAIAGALKMLGEVAGSWKLLDVRLSRQAGTAGTPARPDLQAVPRRATGS